MDATLTLFFLFRQIGREDVSKDQCWDGRHNPHDHCETNSTHISLIGGRGSRQANRHKNTHRVGVPKKR